MEKVNISEYASKSYIPSIIVNISDKPFYFMSYSTFFYAHKFDDFVLNEENLIIYDNYFKQLNIGGYDGQFGIISQSNGASDYKYLSAKSVAFALYSSFHWRPSQEPYTVNTSGASKGSIYAGTDADSNNPDVYMCTELRKMLTTNLFGQLDSATKLEFIRNILPFYTYADNKVALNLMYKLQASGKSGIKSGQFIL